MTYAIIQIAGKQYRVSPGDQLVVDRLQPDMIDKNQEVLVSDVLLVHDGQTVHIGTPTVQGAQVSLKHEAEQRGEKLRIFKYKAKARSRKTMGFRAEQSVLTVEKITV